MSKSKRVLVSLVGLLAALALCACGGAALGEAATPEQDRLASELEQRAADLDAELARLEKERGQADQAQATSTEEAATPAGEVPGTAGPVEARDAVAQSAPADEEPTEEQERPSKRERCKTACRALDSMQRSSERICSLTGESHEKCSWARSQVDDARGRVERAGCSCEK
jgi:hypothetical protein